ncbi:sensor histidine kinase [Phycicoccus avicenniae]|uniref:sensor histidine kinase n=1 Tax=Phycicoccus avicenniae TaxID=2828860 RepID=UPI003D29E76C
MTSGLRGWMAGHPRAVDAGIATAVFVLSLLAVPATPDTVAVTLPPATPTVVALLAVGCAALLLRRIRPVLAWVIALTAAVVPIPSVAVGRGLPAAVAALYAVAAHGGRRAALACTLATMGLTLVLLDRGGFLAARDPVSYAVIAWCGLAAALGDAARSNREVLRAALDRARQAEESREQEADRRVAAERLRISRELHDVVAHHLAVVNVQAGVAEHLAASDPSAATAALAQVRAASARALREMGALVGLLRSPAEPAEPAPTSPAPRVDDLGALVEAARSGGLEVTWTHEGPPLGGTPGDDLHLYRLVQEALTNAARHGAGRAVISTRQATDRVVLEVVNDVTPPGPTSVPEDVPAEPAGGHGLVGMRERVALVGGVLEAGVVDGRFRIRAVLPVGERG